jgi:hypothetical protein
MKLTFKIMSSTIANFARTFVWEARDKILPASLAMPGLIEGVKVASYLRSNHQAIGEKISDTRDAFFEGVTQKKGETPTEFKKRVGFGITKSLLKVGMLAGIAFGFFTLISTFPPFLVIPAAVAAICLVGELMINGKAHLASLAERAVKVGDFLEESFTRKIGESDSEARWRIGKNVLIATVCTVAVCAVVVGLASGLNVVLANAALVLAKSNFSVWGLQNLLPSQTPVVVFMEYLAVGLLHGVLAVKKWLDGDKKGAIFHFINLGLSIFFPFMYLSGATAAVPMRLHHSFIGLLLQLSPFRALRALGGMITLDSALYFLAPIRGGLEQLPGGVSRFFQYDFQNIIVDNLNRYLSTLAVLCGIQYAVDRLLPKNDER